MTVALVSVPLMAVLAACGAGTDDGAPASDVGGSSARDVGAPEVASVEGADTDDAATDGQAVSTSGEAVIERSVIATGALRLATKKLDDVRQDAISLTTGLGGHVANERSRSDSRGRLDRVDLTLRVPSKSFDKALDDLGRLGTVRNREQSVQDVTTQVIDNEARVKTQAASVASIERLLARATTIGEIMSIERQLAGRQAELDSLKQQQKWLADQTSMSTIQLTLTRPAVRDDDDGSGFLGGLEDGWHALGKTFVALGTGVGAALPFAAVIALFGVPAWMLVRRRRIAQPAPEA